MTLNPPKSTDFNPLLIAGLLAKPLPKMPINHAIHHITQRIQNNHPAILDRLLPLSGTEFVIRPTDLPHNIRLSIRDTNLTCSLDDDMMPPPDVIITGSFMSLLDMISSKVDGDSLFFSRNLSVEGDTEALLTLRNALDSDDIDIQAEIFDAFGPFKKPAESLLNFGGRIFHVLSQDMTTLNRAMIRPLADRCEGLEQENNHLRQNMSQLEQKITKTQAKVHSLSRKLQAKPSPSQSKDVS